MDNNDLDKIIADLFDHNKSGELEKIRLISIIGNMDFTLRIFGILLKVGLSDVEEEVRRNALEILFEIFTYQNRFKLKEYEDMIKITIETFSFDVNESIRAQVLAFATKYTDKEYSSKFIERFRSDPSDWVRNNVKYLEKNLNKKS